jgi:hypothetical protein
MHEGAAKRGRKNAGMFRSASAHRELAWPTFLTNPEV